MAKFELKFLDVFCDSDFIVCEKFITTCNENLIKISGKVDEEYFSVFLDKSTAIKFAKTLRTEINKITESEVQNG